MTSKSTQLVFIAICLICVIQACPEGQYPKCVPFSCPDNFIKLYEGCYLFSTNPVPYMDGSQYCKSLNSELVSIETLEESKAIHKFLSDKYGKSKVAFWTSGSDIYKKQKYYWLATAQAFKYTDWCPKEPNYMGDELCVQLYHDFDTTCWNNLFCERTHVKLPELTAVGALCEHEAIY